MPLSIRGNSLLGMLQHMHKAQLLLRVVQSSPDLSLKCSRWWQSGCSKWALNSLGVLSNWHNPFTGYSIYTLSVTGCPAKWPLLFSALFTNMGTLFYWVFSKWRTISIFTECLGTDIGVLCCSLLWWALFCRLSQTGTMCKHSMEVTPRKCNSISTLKINGIIQRPSRIWFEPLQHVWTLKD